MSLLTVLQIIMDVIGANQTMHGADRHGISMVAGLRWLVPADVVIEIPGKDGGWFLEQLRIGI